MSARVTAGTVCAIYDSVSGLPVMTEVFYGEDGEDEAEAFIQWVVEQGYAEDIRAVSREELAEARATFEAHAAIHEVPS